MAYLKRSGLGLLAALLVLAGAKRAGAANSIAPYVSTPIFMSNAALLMFWLFLIIRGA